MVSKETLLAIVGIGATAVLAALALSDSQVRIALIILGAGFIALSLIGFALLWFRKRIHLHIGRGLDMSFHDQKSGRRRRWIRFRLFNGPIIGYDLCVEVQSKQPDGSYKTRDHTGFRLFRNKQNNQVPTTLYDDDHIGLFRNVTEDEAQQHGLPIDVAVLYVAEAMKRTKYKGTLELGTHDLKLTLSAEDLKNEHVFWLALDWTGNWETYSIKAKKQPRWPDRIVERIT